MAVTGDISGETAISRTTGLPLAIGTDCLLSGKISQKGVVIPTSAEILTRYWTNSKSSASNLRIHRIAVGCIQADKGDKNARSKERRKSFPGHTQTPDVPKVLTGGQDRRGDIAGAEPEQDSVAEYGVRGHGSHRTGAEDGMLPSQA